MLNLIFVCICILYKDESQKMAHSLLGNIFFSFLHVVLQEMCILLDYIKSRIITIKSIKTLLHLQKQRQY